MPSDQIIRGILFLSCVSVCCQFNLHYYFLNRIKRYRLHIWHAYSTNDALSNDTMFNNLVTLTLTLVLKIAFLDLAGTRGTHSVSQTRIFVFILKIGRKIDKDDDKAAGDKKNIFDVLMNAINHTHYPSKRYSY